MSEIKTVASELTDCEKDRLDISKWYALIKELSDRDITLFFQRLRELQLKRISSGTSEEQLKEIHQTTKGITVIESKFLQIKKEQLKA